MAFVIIGEDIAHHSLYRIRPGTEIVNVIETVTVVSAQAVGCGHPDIAVGILSQTVYLVAGQSVGRTDMPAVGQSLDFRSLACRYLVLRRQHTAEGKQAKKAAKS